MGTVYNGYMFSGGLSAKLEEITDFTWSWSRTGGAQWVSADLSNYEWVVLSFIPSGTTAAYRIRHYWAVEVGGADVGVSWRFSESPSSSTTYSYAACAHVYATTGGIYLRSISYDKTTYLQPGDVELFGIGGSGSPSIIHLPFLIPDGTHSDPIPVYSKYNIGHTFSGYSIYNGKLTSEFQWYFSPTSGYEGMCLDINSFNLTPGKIYTMSFILTIPSGTSFYYNHYPFGIKYSNTAVAASSTAFNQTPDVNFSESIGDQTVSITFTADTTNYMLLCMGEIGSASNLFLMKYITFTET